MNPQPKPNSLVFASGTTPAEAMAIHKLVESYAPGALLQAPLKEEWHYKPKFGFSYGELDTSEPVQAALWAVICEREARLARNAERNRDVHFFVEPLGVVLIILGAVGGGIAGKVGEDLYQAGKGVAKKGWAWLRHRLAKDDGKRELVELFAKIGETHNAETGWNPIILLQVPMAQLTFIVEPGLPEDAALEASHEIRRKAGPVKDKILQWSEGGSCWRPIDGKFDENAWKQLRLDIGQRAQRKRARIMKHKQ